MLPESYTAVHRYDGAIIQRQRCDHPERCALRQRDLAIVRDVWRYHFLTTNQLRELWWPGKSLQAARRRLVKLLRAGYLERFRPHSPRGSYEWTYFLSARGHHLLRQLGVIDLAARFKPRDVFDYGRAVHDIQLNAWVLAYRRLLGPQLLDWRGERQITPPREARQSQPRLDDHWSIEGLRDPHPRPVVPDATLEIADQERDETRLFLIEFDRTSRTDKNYDKFRRYDAYLASWWRHTELAGRAEAPYVLFICQHDAQRDDFLARADRELTGHRWHPSHPPDEHEYPGRRHMLFCNERDAHLGQCEARRLPQYPPGHPARQGPEAEIRGVRLPGRSIVDESRGSPESVDGPQDSPSSVGASRRLTAELDSGTGGAGGGRPSLLSPEAMPENPNGVHARGGIGARPDIRRWFDEDAGR